MLVFVGNGGPSSKQVGSQASYRITRRLAWIQPVCISINAVPALKGLTKISALYKKYFQGQGYSCQEGLSELFLPWGDAVVKSASLSTLSSNCISLTQTTDNEVIVIMYTFSDRFPVVKKGLWNHSCYEAMLYCSFHISLSQAFWR